MLVWQRSEPGTIRGENQDVLVVREDQGVLLLVDGRGPGGRDLAHALATHLERELLRLPLYGRPADTPDRLRGIFAEAHRLVRERQVAGQVDPTCGIDVAAAVVVEGQLVLANAGTGGLLAKVGGTAWGLEPRGLPMLTHEGRGSSAVVTARAPVAARPPLDDPQVHGPVPITVGDWVMLFSEGLLASQPLDEVARVAGAVASEPDDIAEGLFQRASQRYDGDDRTMVLARFLPRDLQQRFPPDRVVSVEIDRRHSIPLWKPLAVVGAAFLAVGSLFLIAWRRVR
ncbi:MAG: hypothetical protein GX442_07850 [Candidatus Riflebacteria bacterium]|nr:hypothetical protein [Candidatus Riflebacteria bacterium]